MLRARHFFVVYTGNNYILIVEFFVLHCTDLLGLLTEAEDALSTMPSCIAVMCIEIQEGDCHNISCHMCHERVRCVS